MSQVLYIAIVESIKSKIHNGELRPGDMLASEASLVQEYGASRMTVRKSLSLLASEGYIYSIAGKGSFVCTPQTNNFKLNFNRYEDLALPIDGVKLLSVDVGHGPERARSHLKAPVDSLVLTAERLLLSGSTKVADETLFFIYLPNIPVVEDRLRFANHMEGMEQRMAFTLAKRMNVRGAVADEKTASRLQIDTKSALILIEEEILNLDDDSVYSFSELYLPLRFFQLQADTLKNP